MTDDYYDDIDRDMKIVIFVITIAIFAFAGLMIYLMKNDNIHINKMRKACEAQNGTLLDHTTRVGKADHHDYVCVNKDIIIEYKTK